MSDYDAILRAILNEPEDDLHRLALADWLEENGNTERAADIRYALYVGEVNSGRSPESVPPAHWVDDYNELSRRLPRMIFGKSRGFISFVRCTMQDWMDSGVALVSKHPIEKITVIDKQPHIIEYGGGDDRWAWYKSQMPIEVWQTLCPGAEPDCNRFEFGVDVAVNRELAVRAFEQACIRWARTESGLYDRTDSHAAQNSPSPGR